jgi:hypothetical protein
MGPRFKLKLIRKSWIARCQVASIGTYLYNFKYKHTKTSKHTRQMYALLGVSHLYCRVSHFTGPSSASHTSNKGRTGPSSEPAPSLSKRPHHRCLEQDGFNTSSGDQRVKHAMPSGAPLQAAQVNVHPIQKVAEWVDYIILYHTIFLMWRIQDRNKHSGSCL